MRIKVGSLLDFLPEFATVKQGLNIATQLSNAVTPGARRPVQRRPVQKRPMMPSVKATSPYSMRSAPNLPEKKPDDKTLLYVGGGVAALAIIFLMTQKGKK